MVTNILLSLLLLVICLSNLFIYVKMRQTKEEIVSVYDNARQSILDFIMPLEEGKPSALATTCEVFASMIGRAVTAQIKTTLMGMQSGDNRQIASVEGAIAQDKAAQMGFGSVLESFPFLRKSIKKNPQLMDVAMQLIANRLQPNTGSNGHSESPKFKL